jgi:hypothetical protein
MKSAFSTRNFRFWTSGPTDNLPLDRSKRNRKLGRGRCTGGEGGREPLATASAIPKRYFCLHFLAQARDLGINSLFLLNQLG